MAGTLTVVGLGPGGRDAMSVGAHRLITGRGRVLVRTERHPAVADLKADGVSVESLDVLYEDAENFDTLYERIADAVLARTEREGSLLYAVPGHPLLGERSVSFLLDRAASRGVEIAFVGSAGFPGAALVAARVAVDADMLLLDAFSLASARLDASIPTLIYQIHDRETASAVKLALMERYPDEHPVIVVAEGRTAQRTPLLEMDRRAYDHLTSVFVPPAPEGARRPAFDDLVRVITTLRAPGGCPWDREQTHESLKRNLLEEAYEVLEAIERDDPAGLEEELGDLLMQPVMHAVIAAEEGVFTLDDVIAGITRKLIRRHPHVFGEAEALDTDAVLRSWEAIKRSEKGNADRASALDGVPATMPALMRATDISRKAAKVGFEWPDAAAVLDKVREEVEELGAEIRDGNAARAAEEIGDLLFAIVNVARWLRVDPEDSLRAMLARFSERFRAMEAMAAADDRPLVSLSAHEWDAYWERAKG